MSWRNSIEGYGAVPQVLHWITVALVVLAWLLGQFDSLPAWSIPMTARSARY